MPDISFLLFVLAFIFVCLWQGKGRFWGCLIISVFALVCWAFMPRTIAIIHADPISVSYIQDHQKAVLHHFPKSPPSFINRQVDEYFGFIPGIDLEAIPFEAKDLQCDLKGCSFALADQTTLLYSESPISYVENCQVAQNLANDKEWFILLSSRPIERARHCEGDRIRSIAFFDLWRNGSYKVTQSLWSGEVALYSVEKERGYRPWTTKQMRWDKRRRNRE